MTEFTKTISNAAQGKKPVVVEKGITGTVNALGQGVNNVVSVFNNRATVKDANAKAALAARENEAMDALARTSFDAMTTPEGREIGRINNAINSGSTSSRSGRSRLDVQIRSLLNQYPDMAFEMFQQFDELGISSRLFREYNAQEKAADQQEEDQRTADTSARQAVTARGVDTSNMEDSEVLTLGRSWIYDQWQFGENKRVQDLIFSRNAEERSQRTEQRQDRAAERAEESHALSFEKHGIAVRSAQRQEVTFAQQQEERVIRETNRNAFNFLTQQNSRVVPYAVRDFKTLVDASDGSPESLKALDERAGRMIADLLDMEVDGLQQLRSLQGMDQGTLDNYSKGIQQDIAIIKALNDGDHSVRQRNTNAVNDFIAHTKLTWQDSAEVLSAYTAIFGGQGAAMFIAGDAGLGPEFAEKAGKDLRSFLDKVGLSAETGDSRGDPEVATFWNGVRQATRKGYTPELGKAYATSVMVSSNEVPTVMNDAQASMVISDLLKPGSMQIIDGLRKDMPEEAMTMESKQSEAVHRAMNSMMLKGGVTSWDREGALAGTKDTFTTAGPMGGPITVRQEAKGVMWDDTSKQFIGYGGRRDKASSDAKARALNSGLEYMKNYYSHYGLGSEDELLQFLVYEEYPELQSAPTDINRAAESLPQ